MRTNKAPRGLSQFPIIPAESERILPIVDFILIFHPQSRFIVTTITRFGMAKLGAHQRRTSPIVTDLPGGAICLRCLRSVSRVSLRGFMMIHLYRPRTPRFPRIPSWISWSSRVVPAGSLSRWRVPGRQDLCRAEPGWRQPRIFPEHRRDRIPPPRR